MTAEEFNTIGSFKNSIRCPNPNCSDSGGYPEQIDDDEFEQVQCEFCWTNPNSFFNIAATFEAKAAQIKADDDEYYKDMDEILASYENDNNEAVKALAYCEEMTTAIIAGDPSPVHFAKAIQDKCNEVLEIIKRRYET